MFSNRLRPRARTLTLAFLLALSAATGLPATAQDKREEQNRPHGTAVAVPVDKVKVDDGDTVVIAWDNGDNEIVRILGIDTPETQHIEHNIPYDQSFGREALGFARGAFATATEIQIKRAPTKDPYGRSLAYLFLNGRNYSALIVGAGLAAESVSHYGDNGFPEEAKAVLDAAAAAGPLPFEPPFEFRNRMRKVADAMKAQGAK
ncbi:MAG: thermonuclease family protein [Candidatus Eisenbacteria bacterium]|nr:thermonuclease family protein [Candidatus Eisenbacteria bacterium]